MLLFKWAGSLVVVWFVEALAVPVHGGGGLNADLDPTRLPKGMEPRFANDLIWSRASSLKDAECRAFVANVLRMGARLDNPARDPAFAERALAASGL